MKQPLSSSHHVRVHHRTALGQAQREKTRLLIIESAIAVFAAHGPHAPVIEDFAKAAGVSRATFYNYFQTTRELLEATMAHIWNELTAAIIPAVLTEPNPILRLATAMRMFYRKARLDPLFRTFLEAVPEVGNLAIVRVHTDLQEAMELGLTTIKDLELAEAIALGVMIFALRSPNVESSGPERAHEVMRAVLNALGVSPELIEQAVCRPLPPSEPVA